jgi:dTDP-4-dehydrorhamnose reductase
VTTRVLVTGAAGQVGVDLVDVLRGESPPGSDVSWQPDGRHVDDDEFEVLALTHHELDVTDDDLVMRALRQVRPDVVVNLAAYTAVDRAESDVAACELLNRDAVGHLSRACAEMSAHFVTVSTDYVFRGDKGDAYVEDDPTGPLNVYGRTKREGELLCRDDDTIVRTSWVMGVRGRNIARVVIERARRGEPMRFVTDQVGSPTFAADLARALVTVVRERPGGVWHFANAGHVTWFDVATQCATFAGASRDLVSAITTDELDPRPAATRPARSDLATTKWVARGLEAPREWSDALRRLVADC